MSLWWLVGCKSAVWWLVAGALYCVTPLTRLI